MRRPGEDPDARQGRQPQRRRRRRGHRLSGGGAATAAGLSGLARLTTNVPQHRHGPPGLGVATEPRYYCSMERLTNRRIGTDGNRLDFNRVGAMLTDINMTTVTMPRWPAW